MKPAVIAVSIVFASCLAHRALADRVVLKDGQVLEGVVTESGDTVTITLDYGTIGLPRDEVKSIEKTSSALAELEKRKALVPRTDAAALRELAAWAEKNGLETQARLLYRQVLELAPDDATAHERLGHQKIDGKWLTEDEVMMMRGYVRYNGTWKTSAEAKLLDNEEDARRQRSKEREEEARRLNASRAIASASAPASATGANGGRSVLDTPVRPRTNFPAYERYDDATEDLYVTPWMNAAIFFPMPFPDFKAPAGSTSTPPATTPTAPPVTTPPATPATPQAKVNNSTARLK